jgi:hypothetical protein
METAAYLPSMAVFMGIFALGSLLLNFYLSKGDTKAIYLAPLAALAQIVGIWFVHGSIASVIKVNTLSSFTLLLVLLIYLGYETRKSV